MTNESLSSSKTFLERKGYWEIFIYLFLVVWQQLLTLSVSIFRNLLFELSMPVSNTISWICSVLFAFVTNKIWVFHSKSPSFLHLIIEFGKFIFYRVVSYGMDMGAMLLMIQVMHVNDYVAKIITQVIVVLANYIFSKLFIFKETEIIEKELPENQNKK